MSGIQKLLAVLVCLIPLSATAAGDAVAGEKKAVTCFGCHGADGVSLSPNFPNLAGQQEIYLTQQIKAFRDGTRINPIMSPMAKSLSDDDIANIAAFFANLAKKEAPVKTAKGVSAAETKYEGAPSGITAFDTPKPLDALKLSDVEFSKAQNIYFQRCAG
jgi:cytochrome c553